MRKKINKNKTKTKKLTKVTSRYNYSTIELLNQLSHNYTEKVKKFVLDVLFIFCCNF